MRHFLAKLIANTFYGYATSKFLPTSEFKSIDPKEFHMNKGISNSSKGCVPEADLISYENYRMIIL